MKPEYISMKGKYNTQKLPKFPTLNIKSLIVLSNQIHITGFAQKLLNNYIRHVKDFNNATVSNFFYFDGVRKFIVQSP